MRYRRLSVGRLGPLAALLIVTGVAGGAWFAADWRNRPGEIKDVSALPPLDQALLDTLAKDRPDLKSALPGFGNNPPLAMLRQQLTAVVKDDLANLAEIANIQAALQLAKAEAENQRVRQTLAALELEKLRAAQTGLPEAGTAPAALPAAPPPSPGQSSSSEPAGTQPAAAALAGVTPSTNVAPTLAVAAAEPAGAEATPSVPAASTSSAPAIAEAAPTPAAAPADCGSCAGKPAASVLPVAATLAEPRTARPLVAQTSHAQPPAKAAARTGAYQGARTPVAANDRAGAATPDPLSARLRARGLSASGQPAACREPDCINGRPENPSLGEALRRALSSLAQGKPDFGPGRPSTLRTK